MIEKYNTILENSEGGLVEKKSRFLSNLFHVEDENEVKEKINLIKKKYYDAKHYAFAYILVKDDRIIEKYTDDGEPSGTAGKPILDMLKQRSIYNVLIIVTRYFGGILLGTGGLSRMYLGGAKIVIDNSKLEEMILSYQLKLSIEYEQFDKIKYFCDINCFNIKNIEYLDKVLIYVTVEFSRYSFFVENVNNILNYSADIQELEKKYVKK